MSDEGSSADGWVLDAWRTTRDELVLFARTVRAFTLGPVTFSRAWVNGALRPMNPLGYLSLCLLWKAPVHIALLWRSRVELDRATQELHISSELLDLLRDAAPYIVPLVFCVLLHPILKMLGSTRRLTTTLGIMLYSEGPELLFAYLAAPLRYWALGHPAQVAHRLYSYVGVVESLPSFAYTIIAMSAAHGRRAWRSAVAMLLAIATFAVVMIGISIAIFVARR